MTVVELLEQIPLEVLAGKDCLDRAIAGGYASDLLSNVMGEASAGQIWVTMQAHQNIVAVAALANLSAIVIASRLEPSPEVVDKANKQHVILLKTSLSAFELIGRLYAMGIKGT